MTPSAATGSTTPRPSAWSRSRRAPSPRSWARCSPRCCTTHAGQRCDVALIAGGKSNLTYRVACDAGEVVLRRPPLGHILPTAHDMAREYRVLSRARGHAPCRSRDVLHLGGRRQRARGALLRHGARGRARLPQRAARRATPTRPEGARPSARRSSTCSPSLHTVDPAAVGLADFGRPAGFMERQLRRWSEQWEASKAHDLPALDALRDELVRTLPAPARGGDRPRRLPARQHHPAPDGAGPDRRRARLGDEHARRPLRRPRRAAGVLERGGGRRRAGRGAHRARRSPRPRLPDPRSRSSSATPRRPASTSRDVDWYQAFAFFKLAVVCQGIAARAAGGAMLGSGFDDAQRLVAPLVDAGRHLLA